jgi:transposase
MTSEIVRYVGLDVHKRVVEACIVDASGKIVHRERFSLNRRTLTLFASKILRPGDHVAFEATTNCWAVADALRPHVAKVVVSNPMATKAIAQAKVKTDKVDAQVLAQLLRCDFLPQVWQPDEATRRLRELTGRRSALVGQRTMMRNRIHSVLAMRLIETPLRLFGGEGLAWLATLELDEQGRMLIDSDLRQAEFLQKEIDMLDAELARRGYAEDRVKLLMTLPGVDVATAESLLAAWGDIARFPDGDHAAGYLGLAPSTKQSANQCYHGPITKRGNSHARWMLIEAAQHLDKHPGPLGHFFRRLAKKKNRNVAVVAGARKLAAIAWMMLKNNEPYRYAIPRTTETKLARLRVRATGVRRKGGCAKGEKCAARLPGGSRTIKSLAAVCQSENVAPPRAISAGELRTIRQTECETFVTGIAAEQVVPRKPTQVASQARKQTNPQETARREVQTAVAHVTKPPRSAKPLHAAQPENNSQASCPKRADERCSAARFRPHRADEQGCSLPPPAPPASLSSSVPPKPFSPAKPKKPK